MNERPNTSLSFSLWHFSFRPKSFWCSFTCSRVIFWLTFRRVRREYLIRMVESVLSVDWPVDDRCDKFKPTDVMSVFCELIYSSYWAVANERYKMEQINFSLNESIWTENVGNFREKKTVPYSFFTQCNFRLSECHIVTRSTWTCCCWWWSTLLCRQTIDQPYIALIVFEGKLWQMCFFLSEKCHLIST